MRGPYFKVGEPVILESVSRPECNEEYLIEKVLIEGDIFICRITGNSVLCGKNSGYFSYLLSEPTMDERYFSEIRWAESALRKKYPPSKLSFNELIKECKSNVVY